MSKVKAGEVISYSLVESAKEVNKQKLYLYVTGIHPKSCSRALRKIQMYESYKDFIDFVTESTYDEKENRINLLFEHSVLPNKMRLKFKIPRIKAPGRYPFLFDWGIFTGLKGTIFVADYQDKCVLMMVADWMGKDTGYSDIVMGAFTQTLSRMALEKLIRISLI